MATDLVVLVGSCPVALALSADAAGLLSSTVGLEQPFARPAGFLVTLLLAALALSLIGNRVLSAVPPRLASLDAERLLAIPPAMAHAALIAAAVLLLLALPTSPAVKADVQASSIGGRILDEAPTVERELADIFGDAARETLTFFTVAPEADERVTLPFQPADPEVNESVEQRMVDLVNEVRAVAASGADYASQCSLRARRTPGSGSRRESRSVRRSRRAATQAAQRIIATAAPAHRLATWASSRARSGAGSNALPGWWTSR